MPGPELGALLAGIEISALAGADVVEVLRTRSRQLAHEQAQLLAAMVEVGMCDPAAEPDEVVRLEEPPPYAADEIRAALAWTRRAAEREYEFAQALVTRMRTGGRTDLPQQGQGFHRPVHRADRRADGGGLCAAAAPR